MSSHTPGPLLVTGSVLEEDKPHGRVIGYSAGESEAVDLGEAQANLLLWRAAPDLFAALQLCVDVLPGLEVRSWPPGHRMKKEALEAARAAIAKAVMR